MTATGQKQILKAEICYYLEFQLKYKHLYSFTYYNKYTSNIPINLRISQHNV